MHTGAFHDYETLEFVNHYQGELQFEKTNRLPNVEFYNEHFQEVVDTNTPLKIHLGNTRTIESYFPLLNAPECRFCHGHDHMIRGIVHFTISVKGVYDRIRKARLILTAIFLIAGSVIAIVLIYSIRSIIIRPLHDIGKVGVPDAILLKPDRLTAEEWHEMQKHTIYGREALRVAEERLGSNSFLRIAGEIAHSHHEKWDGSGYPRRLMGEGIPVSGRLMALADVYDALISKRVYKQAFTHSRAKEIIIKGRGTHFDPLVVEAFLAQEVEFKHVANRYK